MGLEVDRFRGELQQAPAVAEPLCLASARRVQPGASFSQLTAFVMNCMPLFFCDSGFNPPAVVK